ncbi:MAG: sugar phosphate isomerase/epimerase [Subtercola sp.]|nr:sugar phosphate isomerase/epimerase [Subtercola sp.]
MSAPSVSLQLYSVRNALEVDAPETIRRVAAIGFTQVEASFRFMSRMPDLLPAIQSNGLKSPTMTAPLVGDEADLDGAFAAAVQLGSHSVIETVVREDHWSSREAVADVARQLNAAAEKAAGFGLRVGYHNHWWELEQKFDGQPAFDLLIDQLDERVVLEVDAYWVGVGGEDPVAFVERHADRVRFLHLKDGPITRDTKLQVAPGDGLMPLSAIITAATNLEVAVVEFDDFAGDVFDVIGPSRERLNEMVAA